MDQRLRDVEGDVVTLKDWRSRTVDPWISSGKEFRETVGRFITRLESQEELRQQLNDERHRTNNFKLNFILTLATIGLLLVALTSLYVSVQATKHSLVIFPDEHSFNASPTETAQDAVIPPLRTR